MGSGVERETRSSGKRLTDTPFCLSGGTWGHGLRLEHDGVMPQELSCSELLNRSLPRLSLVIRV